MSSCDGTSCCAPFFAPSPLQGFAEKSLQFAKARLAVGTDSWKQQFADALTVDVGEDEEEEGDECEDEPRPEPSAEPAAPKKPTLCQLALHYLFLPWKLLFAFIPPTAYMHGEHRNLFRPLPWHI